jgi:hypothetical protein
MVSLPYQTLKLSKAFQSSLENEALSLVNASSKRATCSKIGNNYHGSDAKMAAVPCISLSVVVARAVRMQCRPPSRKDAWGYGSEKQTILMISPNKIH